MSVTQFELLTVLADGRFHSGVELGSQWGISRSAVSKLIQKFSLPGLKIYRVRGKGYRLSETLYLLNKQQIIRQLAEPFQVRIADIKIFDVVPSTNSYFLELVEGTPQTADEFYKICFSEMQTAGRGSRGRRWASPIGHNIYLSMLRTFDAAPLELGGLSIVVGLALVQAIRQFGVDDVGFKWPNDIFVNSRKAAGILVETRSQAFGVTNVVIGVGVNLKVEHATMGEVDQPWSAIGNHGFNVSQRNSFAGNLLQLLMQFIEEFRTSGLSHFNQELVRFDLLRGKTIELSSGQTRYSGVEVGIDNSGRLLIRTENGVRSFSSGEVSIRQEKFVDMVKNDS